MKTTLAISLVALMASAHADDLSRIGLFRGGTPDVPALQPAPIDRFAPEVRQINGTNYDVGRIRALMDAQPSLKLAWINLEGEVVAKTADGLILQQRWIADVVVGSNVERLGRGRTRVTDVTEKEERFSDPVLLVNHPRSGSVEVGEVVKCLALRTGEVSVKRSTAPSVVAEVMRRYDHGTPPPAEEMAAAEAKAQKKADEKKRKLDDAVAKFRAEQAAKAALESSTVSTAPAK